MRMLYFKIYMAVQAVVFRLSGGILMNKIRGFNICLVKMKGAKSERIRHIPLMLVPYEKGVVLVASLGGAPAHPSWYWNLKANPEILVYLNRQKLNLVAKQVDDEKKAELWPLICSCYPDYDLYQKRTKRNIPVFDCQPA